MPFKDISYLELWQPFCSAEWNHLCNFVGGYNEEQFCEIIFEFGPVEMSLKDVSYIELWRPFCSAEQNRLCNFD